MSTLIIEASDLFDKHYPPTDVISKMPDLMAKYIVAVLEKFTAAPDESTAARTVEFSAIRLIGQIRRGHGHAGISRRLPRPLLAQIDLAIDKLRASGRTVDMENIDPRMWISKRGGDPRW